jgi:hypothetical protein
MLIIRSQNVNHANLIKNYNASDDCVHYYEKTPPLDKKDKVRVSREIASSRNKAELLAALTAIKYYRQSGKDEGGINQKKIWGKIQKLLGATSIFLPDAMGFIRSSGSVFKSKIPAALENLINELDLEDQEKFLENLKGYIAVDGIEEEKATKKIAYFMDDAGSSFVYKYISNKTISEIKISDQLTPDGYKWVQGLANYPEVIVDLKPYLSDDNVNLIAALNKLDYRQWFEVDNVELQKIAPDALFAFLKDAIKNVTEKDIRDARKVCDENRKLRIAANTFPAPTQRIGIQNQTSVTVKSTVKDRKAEILPVKGAVRPGYTKDITIPIGTLDPSLRPCDDDLPEIFKTANAVTINRPYDISPDVKHIQRSDGTLATYPFNNDSIDLAGKTIHRPNHDGTHSARQARYFDAVFGLVAKEGTYRNKELIEKLITPDEKFNLKLAAYFLRAGRVDESGHGQVDNGDSGVYKRSAQVYMAYARQLGVDEEIIRWTARQMEKSTQGTPTHGNNTEKEIFAQTILGVCHELDLFRCKPNNLMQTHIGNIKRDLRTLTGNDSSYGKLEKYAFGLLNATGSNIQSTGFNREFERKPYNPAVFPKCSTDGSYCWNKTAEVPRPNW